MSCVCNRVLHSALLCGVSFAAFQHCCSTRSCYVDLISSCECLRLRFLAIFGTRNQPGNEQLANQVLLDYCLEFPEAEENNRKKRGNIQLTNYVTQRGFRRTKKNTRKRRKMDYEAFCGEMNKLCGWSTERSHAEWKVLDIEANYADDTGYGAFKRRIRVPASLLCLDESESGDEQYEDRSVATRGQYVKNASEKQKVELLGEMSKGFSELQVPNKDEMSQALPKTAFSLGSEERIDNVSLALVREAAGKMGIVGIPSPAKSTGTGLGDQQQPPQQPGGRTAGDEQQHLQNPFYDHGSARTSFMRSKNGATAGLTKKVQEVASKAALSLKQYLAETETQEDDEYQHVVERLQLLLLWLNTKPAGDKDSTGKAHHGPIFVIPRCYLRGCVEARACGTM